MTTFCDDHEWCSDDDSAMCPHCLATWSDFHEARPVMKEPVYQVMYLGLDGGGWIDVDLQTMESHARYPDTFQTRTLWMKKGEK